MDVFSYPTGNHVRRHGPRGYMNPDSYKPWLRDEFAFRCIYCLCRETWFPDGQAAFSIDHLLPQTAAPQLRLEYDNLVYACIQCNSMKGTSSTLDPCQESYAQHVRILDDGTVEALSKKGRDFIDICRLNRPDLVSFRRHIVELVSFLGERNDPKARGLRQKILGFPASFPNLSKLRPPLGNSRPEGIEQSFIARKERGELEEIV